MTCSGSRLYSYKAPHASSFTKPARCSLVRWITSTDGQFFGKEVQVFTTAAFHIILLNYLVYRESLGKLLFYKHHMSCGQNLVHGASWSRVGPGRPLSVLQWWQPHDPLNTTLVIPSFVRYQANMWRITVVYNVGVQPMRWICKVPPQKLPIITSVVENVHHWKGSSDDISSFKFPEWGELFALIKYHVVICYNS